MIKKNNYKFLLRTFLIVLILSVLFPYILFSQQSSNSQTNNNQDNSNKESKNTTIENTFLPRNYKDFELGMDIEEFNKIFKNTTYLFNEGEIPLTLGEQEKHIFKASIMPYILKLLFYFYKNKLSMLIFYYNSEKISVYEKLQSLTAKYGPPQRIDNFRFFWEDKNTIMILQKDNSLKVIDKEFIQTLGKDNKKIEEIEKLSKEQIFDNF